MLSFLGNVFNVAAAALSSRDVMSPWKEPQSDTHHSGNQKNSSDINGANYYLNS